MRWVSEVECETRMGLKPVLYCLGLVSAAVIEEHVHCGRVLRLPIDEFQELKKLQGTVSLVVLPMTLPVSMSIAAYKLSVP